MTSFGYRKNFLATTFFRAFSGCNNMIKTLHTCHTMCYPNIVLLHGEDFFKKFYDPEYVYNY